MTPPTLLSTNQIVYWLKLPNYIDEHQSLQDTGTCQDVNSAGSEGWDKTTDTPFWNLYTDFGLIGYPGNDQKWLMACQEQFESVTRSWLWFQTSWSDADDSRSL